MTLETVAADPEVRRLVTTASTVLTTRAPVPAVLASKAQAGRQGAVVDFVGPACRWCCGLFHALCSERGRRPWGAVPRGSKFS